MNGLPSISDYFHTPMNIPGGVTVLLRERANPEPLCLSLVDLTKLDVQGDYTSTKNVAATCLSQEELKLFKGYTYPKRKREWLGGRLAAKLAFLVFSGLTITTDQLHAISILPRENGSPTISNPDDPKDATPSLSISHSGNYAVALVASATSCGIDIQHISKKTERVADKFCTEDEVQLLQKCAPQLTSSEQLTLLWVTKEALKKSLLKDQPTIFQGVTLLSIKSEKEFTLQLVFPAGLSRPARITALRLEDYMLAYTTTEQSNA